MPTSTRPATTQYSSSSSASSTDSESSYRLGMDVRPVASVEVLRCLRCHRHVETTSTDDLASTGMIRVGFNLYYCTKCATAVGYKRLGPSDTDYVNLNRSRPG
ncbi:hypothetical protein GGR51DRAFT_567164 [Nemania sp. FL0031]|nr:hypothetical protein GGR51DRAFT_567164 [Nemania sp. FL0031]